MYKILPALIAIALHLCFPETVNSSFGSLFKTNVCRVLEFEDHVNIPDS
jgi:hypothetical protein